jgi:phosphatidylserine/phosphatidylglycerophosphate/cardiolipin synthase-like enzyme
MRRIYRWIFLSLAGITVLAGGAALGLLVVTRIVERPTADFAFAADDLSNGGFSTFETQIREARSEILLCAGQLSSANLLKSLKIAQEKGVTIKIVLDGGDKPDLRRGAIGFIRANKIGELRLTKYPLYDQFLVIDGTRLFFTSAPWTAAAAGKNAEASVFFLQQKGAANMARKLFERRYAASEQVL